MSDTGDGDQNTESLASRRTRRSKSDRLGRSSAFERLKAAKEKGAKNKYEVRDETDVYEEVDEREYTRIVQERLEDDWIVDDDGSGYVEDGREIFDEELDDASVPAKGGKKNDDKKSRNPNIRAPGSKPKSIKSMFAAAAVKSKPKIEKSISLNDDDLLGDIMAELHSEPLKPTAILATKKKSTPSRSPAVNPFGSGRKSLPKPNLPTKRIVEVSQPEPMSEHLEMDDEPEAPPPEPVAPPKRIRTALDDIDLDAGLNYAKSEKNRVKEQGQDLDVSDINFDDKFDEEMEVTPAVSRPENKENAKLKEVLLPEMTNTSWETEKSEQPVDIQVDSSQLPLTTNKDGEKVLRMFWLDAYEDYYKQPGTVYLMGKVYIESAKAFVSCCVAVKNIERRIFILPRVTRYDLKNKVSTDTPVEILDVYTEFNERVVEKFKIVKFKSKPTKKQYAFERDDVPAEADYLEVCYSADYPALPSDLQGATFSSVFGTNTSSLELLLLSRKMKGPGWIDIKASQIPNPSISWCKVEAFVTSPDCLSITSESLPPPPLVVMTMNLRTLPNPKSHQNEILGVTCLIHNEFRIDRPAPKQPFQHHFCAITKPSDCVFPFDLAEKVQKQSQRMKVDIIGSERALLGFLLAKIHKVDPDIIVGHDIVGFDLEVLLHRLDQNKVPYWSKIGRLKRANMPRLSGSYNKGRVGAGACSGRIVADVSISAKELIRCRSYDLTELVSQVLKDRRHEVDTDQIRNYYNSSHQLLQLIECGLVDSRFILSLLYELNVLPLALQITNICGNVMARTLLGGRSERNEYLLLHAFTEKDYIVPDKYSSSAKKPAAAAAQHHDDDEDEGPSKRKTGRRKPAYAGGLVLEPKKGFYDKYILLLDFNSLYPSIIQEYNICFTTIDRVASNSSQGEEEEHLPELPDPSLSPGILPTEIRKLVESRKQVKQLMKAPDLSHDAHMQYDIRQKALKLTANSMYGCLGFSFSRFYAKPLAALVTSKGREILMKTKDLVQNMNLDVIYGDTDSIMINTNCTDMDMVYKLGNKVKSEVNKLYKLLEIDIDGVFKSLLLLKKKKYAALTITKVGDKYVEQEELKGLDIVRRDWCELAKSAGNFVVKQILSGKPREEVVESIHSFLLELGELIRDGKKEVELFYITKALTKNPEDYPDKKSLPHVQVAMRINTKGGKKLRAGDTVYYVICDDGSNLGHSQRAYHPDELAKSDTLKIDINYYLSQQIHPVVSRLCDPIDGTDAAQIAECLGLDSTSYRQMLQRQEDEEEIMLTSGQLSAEERYRDCDRLVYICPECGKNIIIDSVFSGIGSEMESVLSKCTNPECKSKPADHVILLMNQLTRLVKSYINKYYQGWLVCEDSACGQKTRLVTQAFQRGHPICATCRRGTLHAEYTDTMLYNQLSFYQYIFDYDKASNMLTDAKEKDISRLNRPLYADAYRKLKIHVDHYLQNSGYSQVNLGHLFQGLQLFK